MCGYCVGRFGFFVVGLGILLWCWFVGLGLVVVDWGCVLWCGC